MNGELSEDLVIIRGSTGGKIYDKSHYGNLTEEGLQLSLIEALLLMEKEKLEVSDGEKQLSIEDMTHQHTDHQKITK